MSGNVGDVFVWPAASAPAGALLADGSTIGNASSGADFTGEQYRALFDQAKNNHPNAGTEDFDSNNTVAILDARGRALLVADDLGGTSANVMTDTEADDVGNGSGAEEHTLLIGEYPTHRHDTHRHLDNTIAAGFQAAEQSGSVNTSNPNGGSGDAHDNMSPLIAMSICVRYA